MFSLEQIFLKVFSVRETFTSRGLGEGLFFSPLSFMTLLSCVSQAVYLYTNVFTKHCFPLWSYESTVVPFFIQAVPNLRYPVTNILTIADSVPRPPLARQNASHRMGILPLKLFFLLNCSLHFFTLFLKGPSTDQVNDLICWEEPMLVFIPSPLLESPSQSSKVMYAIKMWYLSVLIESTIYQHFCFKSIDCYYLLDILTVQS